MIVKFFAVDFPKSPWVSIQKDLQQFPLSDEDEDKSIYQAQLLSNCQDVKLLKGVQIYNTVGTVYKN